MSGPGPEKVTPADRMRGSLAGTSPVPRGGGGVAQPGAEERPVTGARGRGRARSAGPQEPSQESGSWKGWFVCVLGFSKVTALMCECVTLGQLTQLSEEVCSCLPQDLSRAPVCPVLPCVPGLAQWSRLLQGSPRAPVCPGPRPVLPCVWASPHAPVCPGLVPCSRLPRASPRAPVCRGPRPVLCLSRTCAVLSSQDLSCALLSLFWYTSHIIV